MTVEDERKNQQMKKVYIGVIILLILIFIGIFVYSLDKVLAMEGSFPGMFTELKESVIEDPGDNAESSVKLLSDSITKIIEEKPQIDEGRSFSLVDSEEIDDGNGGKETVNYYETDASDSLSDMIQFLKDDIESSLEDSFKCKSSVFGEDAKDVIIVPELTVEDIISASCTYKYYECASCGETSDEPKDSCEACGYAYPYTLKYEDDYTVVLELNPCDKVSKLFGNLSESDAQAVLAEKLTDFADVDKIELGEYKYYLTFAVNRLNGKLSFCEYKKETVVSATVTATGEYTSLGTVYFKDKLVEKDKFSFTWLGISLDLHETTVEPGDSSNLLATLTCNDPTGTTVTWTSSDPDVLTVDAEGYFDANKNADGKIAVITASFELDGVTYEDSCEVTVQIPVESMSLNKRSVKLSAGETFSLQPSFSPKDATFKTVVGWYSSDESIATVSEDGTVTAVATGTATISTYSSDGYYKSTCEVTVK